MRARLLLRERRVLAGRGKETAGKAAQIPPNPQLLANGGTLHQANTIEALAEAAGLPPESLAGTIAEYNDAVRFNRLVTLLPERSTRSGAPQRIETPPFFAIPICAGITNTMGGIAIDGQGRVKRRDGSAIAGLYAAGGTTGGLEGGGALARICRRTDQGLRLWSARRRACCGAPRLKCGIVELQHRRTAQLRFGLFRVEAQGVHRPRVVGATAQAPVANSLVNKDHR